VPNGRHQDVARQKIREQKLLTHPPSNISDEGLSHLPRHLLLQIIYPYNPNLQIGFTPVTGMKKYGTKKQITVVAVEFNYARKIDYNQRWG
jgi:hypothetical protein